MQPPTLRTVTLQFTAGRVVGIIHVVVGLVSGFGLLSGLDFGTSIISIVGVTSLDSRHFLTSRGLYFGLSRRG